ncbi:MAG: hypothetical protein PHU94_00450 [Bacilli bacterium]|nr:hypothetical protein [Bacilli bacterium]MDD4733524.1 hypothetical protein [Bacilli bacterium]
MNSKNYLLIRDVKTKEITYVDYNKEKGYLFSPKKGVNFDGVSINKMIVIKPSFVDKILRRKIKNKLELYLEYIIKLLENDDDTDITGLRSALNDLTRYHDIVKFQYGKYLDERYLELFLKKIKLLEKELQAQIVNYRDIMLESIKKEDTKEEEINRRSR